jgi:hypothetical protein
MQDEQRTTNPGDPKHKQQRTIPKLGRSSTLASSSSHDRDYNPPNSHEREYPPSSQERDYNRRDSSAPLFMETLNQRSSTNSSHSLAKPLPEENSKESHLQQSLAELRKGIVAANEKKSSRRPDTMVMDNSDSKNENATETALRKPRKSVSFLLPNENESKDSTTRESPQDSKEISGESSGLFRSLESVDNIIDTSMQLDEESMALDTPMKSPVRAFVPDEYVFKTPDNIYKGKAKSFLPTAAEVFSCLSRKIKMKPNHCIHSFKGSLKSP